MAAAEEKIIAAISEAKDQVRKADKRAHELEAQLKKHESGKPRIEALGHLHDALEELKQVGGTCPINGDAISDGSYADVINRTKQESETYLKEYERLSTERDKARELVKKATDKVDALIEKQEKEQKRKRREALEAYRREVSAKGFQPGESDTFYHSMYLPWGGAGEDDKRLRRTSALMLLLAFLLSVGIVNFVVPEIEDEEVELPPRLAKLLLEQEKKPEPKPKEQKVDKSEKKAREKAPKPKTEAQRKARDKARQTGLLAFSDTLQDLKDNDFEKKLGSQATLTTSGRKAAESNRSIVTSNVTSSSGGIATSQLSRETGGGNLSGRSTSRVNSALANQLAANRDKRITGSGKASRTDEEIQIVFDRNKSALYSLYNRELRKDPTLQGKIVLKLTIEPSGAVSMCRVFSSSLKAPGLERKIAQRVKLFNFGAKDVNKVTITYPIDFLPA